MLKRLNIDRFLLQFGNLAAAIITIIMFLNLSITLYIQNRLLYRQTAKEKAMLV